MTSLTHRTCTTSSSLDNRRPSLRARITRAYDLWRTRRALAQLTDTQLEDVGLTTDEANSEARRPVWDVPSNWRD